MSEPTGKTENDDSVAGSETPAADKLDGACPPEAEKPSDTDTTTESVDDGTTVKKSGKQSSIRETFVDDKSDDYYYTAYSHFGIHEEMLKDEVRTGTYQRAILEHPHLFKDKIVLDIGCGSGILSLFAAQAGAKHVYGIECSAIHQQAREIVKANGYGDVITIIEGKVEEIELPVDGVDIIISEWMGYFLLYEGMLNTILRARDKWLNPGGIVMPDKAVMYLCGIEDSEYKTDKFDFWDNVYGFDFSTIKRQALRDPLVDIAEPRAIATDTFPILRLNLMTCKEEDLSFKSNYVIAAQRDDTIHALLGYFDIFFSFGTEVVAFSTSPASPYTHWKQTVFYLDNIISIKRGEEITGEIECHPNIKNPRDLDIRIDYKHHPLSAGDNEAISGDQWYYMH